MTDVAPTDKIKKPRKGHKSKLYRNPPPRLTNTERWWEDPCRTAWCELLAHAVALEAVQHMRETVLAAALLKVASREVLDE